MFTDLQRLSRCHRNAASPARRRGNLLAEQEQWAKLAALSVEVAKDVWG